jgi:predicted O-methyltransferase YrrM
MTFHADVPHAVELLDHAKRLLRPGGVLVLSHALFHDRVADPTQRDRSTQDVRALLRAVEESPELLPALVPSGDGVLAAVLRP